MADLFTWQLGFKLHALHLQLLAWLTAGPTYLTLPLNLPASAALEKYLLSIRKEADQQQQQHHQHHQQQRGSQPAATDLGWVARVLFILLQNPLAGDGAGIGGQLIMRISRIVSGTLQGEQRAAVWQVGPPQGWAAPECCDSSLSCAVGQGTKGARENSLLRVQGCRAARPPLAVAAAVRTVCASMTGAQYWPSRVCAQWELTALRLAMGTPELLAVSSRGSLNCPCRYTL